MPVGVRGRWHVKEIGASCLTEWMLGLMMMGAAGILGLTASHPGCSSRQTG